MRRYLAIEKQILQAALQSRKAFNIIRTLTKSGEFSDVSEEVFKYITKFYDTDLEAEQISIDLFKQILIQEIPRHSDIIIKEIETYTETSVPNLLEELTKLRKKAISEEIITELALRPNSESVLELMSNYQDVTIQEIADPVSVSDIARDVLLDLSNTDNLIKIYPNVLNDVIDGGVIGGTHILVFARSNLGKTMFNINLARGMARDGHTVLHLINEEPKKQLLLRYINRCSGLTKSEVYSDIDRAVSIANENGLKNIFIEDINPGTFTEIRGLIDSIKPDVVILDQLRNLTVKEDSRVNGLEKLATEARNLAKRYDIVVVSVTQAGDSASNKLVLTDSDIDSSKTGIPGQCDLIIGLGADNNQKEAGMRTLTVVKNKITSTHGYYPIRVVEDLSKIVSM